LEQAIEEEGRKAAGGRRQKAEKVIVGIFQQPVYPPANFRSDGGNAIYSFICHYIEML
jgi:hypothetical protein